MPNRIRILLRCSILYISITITISILFLSLAHIPSEFVVDISNLDKIQHFFAYVVLTISWLITKNVKFKKITNSSIVIICFVFGIIIEVLQGSITTYRSPGFLDIVANSTGIITGFILFRTFIQKNGYLI
ncbi:MAG: hypothetical protein GKR88_02265 [Flavobacteriaceae bacterium]|nr:MAG: hypothetical protein GKR88_02265 [Flavobacteriaceae bacterium]